MAWQPQRAGPKTIRALYHWVWIQLNEVGKLLDGGGGVPGDGLHESLTDVTPDQHHDKMHAHDGVDGSGPIDYGDLINIPPSNSDKNVDGGFAGDVYLPVQSVDGGTASG
jgi:hypothetical protein